MGSFSYQALPTFVIFGRGSISMLDDVVRRLGASRIVVLSTQRQTAEAEAATLILGDRIAGRFSDARMHTPVDVTNRAMELVRAVGADCVVSFGGGSTIGLGKAVALRTGIPQIAIPTTYAGSEMTPILGETDGGRKVTQRSPSVMPEAVIYDVDLTLDLPPSISGASGLNAIAHAVEGLYAPDANPITDLMAEEGVRALADSLETVFLNGRDVDARERVQYGAWLCGSVLGMVGMGLHHKLCHVLGGDFDMPHAETHAIVLPHVLAHNATAAPRAMTILRRSLDGADPARRLFELGRAVGVPGGLRELGMTEGNLSATVDRVMQNACPNPTPPDPEAILALLRRAWAGDLPAVYETGTGHQ